MFVCFFDILFYIEIKWLLLRNVAAILPLKSKLSRKFQRFNAINRCIEMLKLVEFSKISIKIKNYKTFCKAQIANHLKKFIQCPLINPTRTNLTTSREQFFLRWYIETYKHLLSSRNGVVQIFFLTPHRNIFAGKFVRKVFGCFGSILLSMSSDLRMSEVF